ncbi:MAG: FkbM family methyltransferase [Flavobacterium sp.]
MPKTNKFKNLKRLNFINAGIVLIYLIKTILKIKPSEKEIQVYVYYNILIHSNGYFKSETSDYYVTEFKNNSTKIIKLRKKPSSDIDVFQQVYGWEEYSEVVKQFKQHFHENSDYSINIIDAGSNIGLTSLFFLDHFNKPNIICLEPELENFKILDFNIKNNETHKIVKINAAIWSSNKKIKIVRDFRDRQDWSFRVEETNELDGVQAYSINQLVREYKYELIDILKIDVEGSEKQIFTSENANVDFLEITKCIALEIHDEFNCRNDIYKVLDNYGFSFFNKGELTIGINNNLLNEYK